MDGLDIQAAYELDAFMQALNEMMKSHGIYFSSGMNCEDRIMFHNGRVWASPENDLPNSDIYIDYDLEASTILKKVSEM